MWTLHVLVKSLNFDLDNPYNVLIEFGGGTGQMAKVLKDVKYAGIHVVHDFIQLLVLQEYFLAKVGVNVTLGPIGTSLNRVFHVPAGVSWEYDAYNYDSVTFVATYSLTETDMGTRNAVLPYLKYCDRIYIVFWKTWNHAGDNIDNIAYINALIVDIRETHDYVRSSHFNNGHYFMACRRPCGPIYMPNMTRAI